MRRPPPASLELLLHLAGLVFPPLGTLAVYAVFRLALGIDVPLGRPLRVQLALVVGMTLVQAAVVVVLLLGPDAGWDPWRRALVLGGGALCLALWGAIPVVGGLLTLRDQLEAR